MTAHVATVGASARAAAFSVLRSGRQAVAADLFADADLQQACPVTRISNYPEGLFDWLRQTECDGWLYTGALENYPELVDQLAKVRPLLGNAGSVLRRVRDPKLLGQALKSHDLLFPETRQSPVGLPDDGSWLAKTYQGSSGAGVAELSGETQQGSFFQQRVAGTACSAVDVGAKLFGVTRQLVGEAWTGAGPFQYCGSIAPWQVGQAATGQLRTLGELLVEEFGLRGLFGVDFIVDREQLWPIEVNPRYTAAVEVVERALQTSAIDHWLDERDELPPPENQSAHHGKAILFAKHETTISEEFTRWALTQPALADIPQPGTEVLQGQPMLTVFATAKTSDQALAALKSQAAQLQEKL
jgi:predicted ATP-grasp superfamily ATP-dependent carboligase